MPLLRLVVSRKRDTRALRARSGSSGRQRGRATCTRRGRSRERLDFGEIGDVELRGGPERLELGVPCPACRPQPDGHGVVLTGAAAERALRRLPAFRNYRGGTESQVIESAALVEAAGSAESYTALLAGRGSPLGGLDETESLALEMGASASRERELLGLEAAALERRWREEEEIAGIVDRELSHVWRSPRATD